MKNVVAIDVIVVHYFDEQKVAVLSNKSGAFNFFLTSRNKYIVIFGFSLL